MVYKMDMSKETSPTRRYLFPEGWRTWEVTKMEEKKSKNGNTMFLITLVDNELLRQIEVYAIAEPKKRWFLKEFLAAMGCPASADGVYEFDPSTFIGKLVFGRVEHEDNIWMDREMIEHKDKQARIVEFRQIARIDEI